jgi:hypothetical protein
LAPAAPPRPSNPHRSPFSAARDAWLVSNLSPPSGAFVQAAKFWRKLFDTGQRNGGQAGILRNLFKQLGMLPVSTPNTFWLSLHELAESYRAEGRSGPERTASIIQQFNNMPPIAQRELLRDLLQVASSCPDLYPLAMSAAHNASEQRRVAVLVT